TLRIPSSETMQQLDRKTARAEFSDQWRRYKEGRRKKSATPPPPSQPAADEAVAEEMRAADAVVGNLPQHEPELEVKSEPESQIESQPELETPDHAAGGDAEEAQPEQVQEQQVQEQDTDHLRIGQMQAEATENTGDGPSAAADPGIESLRNRVTQLDESLMASRLENEELRETIKGIEQQLAQLTRLLTLENQPLALAQDPPGATRESSAAETTSETEAEAAAVLPATGDQAATPESLDSELPTSEPAVGEAAVAAESALEPATTQDKWWLDKGGAEPAPATVESGEGRQTVDEAVANGEQATALESNVVAGTETDQVEAAPVAEEAVSLKADVAVTPDTDSPAVAGHTPVTEPGAPVLSGEAAIEGEPTTPPESIAVAAQPGAGGSEASPVVDETAVIRSVLDRSVLDTMKEVPKMVAGSFSELPDTQRRIIAGVGTLVAGLGALGLVRRRRSRKQIATGSGDAVRRAPIETAGPRPAGAATGGIVLSLDDEPSLADETHSVEVAEKASSVDPIAEADVYIAYDHDDQAIQVLQDAWQSNPQEEVGVKLLELHHKHGDRRAFTSLAEELYLQIGGDSSAWAGIAEMGRALNPDNPLFAGAAGGLAAGVAATETPVPGKSKTEAARPILDLDEIGLEDLQPLQADEVAPEKAEGRSGPTLTLEEDLEENLVATDAGENRTQGQSIAEDSFGEELTAEPSELATATTSESDDELETALELAKAYLDLNEQEIARGFIDEVLRDGTEQQKKIAAELAGKIG
ncbi:MAG: FimV/HubP family polar landmark protein, partial [Pseudomonadota bacterium]|nr:FimV/HubP family polar landmark protein [Pseudomonadota bacterium]